MLKCVEGQEYFCVYNCYNSNTGISQILKPSDIPVQNVSSYIKVSRCPVCSKELTCTTAVALMLLIELMSAIVREIFVLLNISLFFELHFNVSVVLR